MLDMGFIPDIERICKLVPFTRQTLFFTATMPPEITRISEQFLHNPVRVEVSRPATAATTITQRLIASNPQDFEKRETLRRLIKDATDLQNAIVFCNRKRDVATLHKSLQRHGFPAVALHGDMDQYARMAALESFRTGENPILVASDVAARGLDIPAVSHVFNFDVPTHAEDYVHRIGRTGRAGRLGAAFTIVTRHDDKLVAAVEKLTGQSIAFEGPGLDALPPGEARDERRGKRDDKRSSSRDRGRGERDRGRGERRPRGNNEAEAAPAVEAAEEPRDTGRRQRPRDEAEPVRMGAPERKERDGRRRNRDEDDGPQVKGLGDHVPAFLLRPARTS
jgi:superfamily II DNA/RNA helicase